MRLRINENTVWTDSQDYGADEILSHPFALAPPVQRAACALHLKNTSRTNRNHPTHSFYISHSFELSPYFLGNHQFSHIIIHEN